MHQSESGRPVRINESDKQFAIHLGVSNDLLGRFKNDANLHGRMVLELDISGLSDRLALTEYLAEEFMYPYRAVGLDAAIDLISDLEWFGNPHGYLVAVTGATDSSLVTADFASLLPAIVDRWRTQDIPFVIAIEEKGVQLQAALRDANDEIEKAGRLQWAQPGTGPVDVIIHATEHNLN